MNGLMAEFRWSLSGPTAVRRHPVWQGGMVFPDSYQQIEREARDVGEVI
jgi:hypothetical protein